MNYRLKWRIRSCEMPEGNHAISFLTIVLPLFSVYGTKTKANKANTEKVGLPQAEEVLQGKQQPKKGKPAYEWKARLATVYPRRS